MCADGVGLWEEGLDLGGFGGGGEVVVLGFLAHELIAHGTACEKNGVPGIAKDLRGFEGVGFDGSHDAAGKACLI